MKKKNALIVLFLILFFVNNSFAQNKVGTSAASFLGIAVGPRPQAMGGAGVAAINDVTSAYWNPGALAKIERSEFKLSHTQWLLGTSFNWIGIVFKMGEQHAIGLSLTQLDVGQEEIVTLADQEGTGRYWDAQFISANVSYAMNLTNRFAMGASLKLIHEQIWHETASAVAVDLGVLYVTTLDGLRLGMSISNFGTNMRLDGDDLLKPIDIDPQNAGNNETLVARLKTEDYELPIFFRIGVAYDLAVSDNHRVTLMADALHPTDNVESMNLGLEYGLNETLFLRGGYKSLFQQDSQEGLTLGAGIHYIVSGFGKIGVDYAWANFGILGDIQTFAFAFSF